MTAESLNRTISFSLSIVLGLSILDFFLYVFFGTVVLTLIAHSISLILLLRYRLSLDLVKFLETSALFVDLYIVFFYGFALVSPFISLISIILILLKKEKYINKLRIDLEKIISSQKKNSEEDI